MLLITYVGPLEGVEIAASGQTCTFGETIEVEDELALRLLDQDIWETEDPAYEALRGLRELADEQATADVDPTDDAAADYDDDDEVEPDLQDEEL